MVPQKMASRMQAAYKKAGQEGGGGTKAHSGAIVIFNIHDCSVGSAPEGSGFSAGGRVISGGMAGHRGRTASRCGERRPDSGSPL